MRGILRQSGGRAAALGAAFTVAAALTGWLAAGHCAGAQDAPAIAISGVAVVDVREGRLLPDQSVLIVGERIAKVAPRAEVQAPEGARVIEGQGLFLIPGLVDAHVHYIDPDSYNALMLAHGVTLVRDMGGPTDATLALRDRLNRGEMLGPEMIAVGPLLDGDPPIWPFADVCRTPEEGRAAVRKQVAKGVDQIKVYSRLDKDVYLAIVDEAHKNGLKAVGHVPIEVTLEEAMQAGQDEDEHLIGFGGVMGRLSGKPEAEQAGQFEMAEANWALYPEVEDAKLREFLEKVRASGMAHCPTLVAMQGIARLGDPKASGDPVLDYVSSQSRAIWDSPLYQSASEGVAKVLPYMQAVVGKLHEAGVTLLCGTDLSNPYVIAGHSLHEEMALWQEAGVPAADVLRSATIVPARSFGLDGRLGTVEEGKTASLVLLRANPLEDVRNARQIEGVFLRGRYLDRAELDGMLNRLKESVKAARPTGERVVLSLPGQVLRRGRYRAKFSTWDAGTEDFLITRADDGYHLMTHSQPTGGFASPFVATIHTDPAFRFRSAEWRQLSESRLMARYTAEGGRIRAEATQDGKPLPAQELELPEDAVVGISTYAGDFLLVGQADLAVGQKKAYQSLSFGYPSWQLQAAPLTVARDADAELTRPDGTRVQARVYTSETQTPVGLFRGQTWTDETGVVLKYVLTMPFGTVEAVLE